MRPAKNSKITDHSLINNTKSIKRKPVCAFNIKTHPRLQKNSNIYKMLKYGPLPDGDYKCLIQNGKITKYARWLIISADLDLRFVELCLLVKIMNLYEALRDRGIIKLILREWLFDQFYFDFDYSTIINALTTLRKRGLIDIAQLRSVSCTDEKILEIQDVMGDDYTLLHNYIEETMSEDMYNPAC